MPTNVKVDDLKINKLTKAQYEAAVQGGTIGEYELSVLTDDDTYATSEQLTQGLATKQDTISDLATIRSGAAAGATAVQPAAIADMETQTHASATYATKAELADKQDIIQYSTMPTAGVDNVDDIVQFVGTTDSTYTNGHFYKCVSDGQDPATYSWEEVSLGGSSYTAGTGIDITNDVVSITSPTLRNKTGVSTSLICDGTNDYYPSSGGQYVTVFGKNNSWGGYDYNIMLGHSLTLPSGNGNLIIGGLVNFTGSNKSGNIVICNTEHYTKRISSGTFYRSIVITARGENNTVYDTTGQYCVAIGAGAGTDKDNSVAIGHRAIAYGKGGVAIGYNASAQGDSYEGGTAIGNNAYSTRNSTSVGYGAKSNGFIATTLGQGLVNNGYGSICIGSAGAFAIRTNDDACVFKAYLPPAVNGSPVEYTILRAGGTIPEARLADTTNAAQGMVLTLDSNLNAVWQAGGSGGGSVPTLTWYTVSTAGNTLTIADTSSAQLVKIYKNGLLLEPTADYSISGTTLTTVTAMVVGDKITTEAF